MQRPGARRELSYVADEAARIGRRPPAGCVVIERSYDVHVAHGPRPVAHYGETLDRCLPALAVLAADERAAAPREPRAARLQWEADRRLADDVGGGSACRRPGRCSSSTSRRPG